MENYIINYFNIKVSIRNINRYDKKYRNTKEIKEYSLIGKIGSFKLQILSSSLSALGYSI